MPLYEYHCNNCEETFEQIVGFSKADLTPSCPFCGGQEHPQENLYGRFFRVFLLEISHLIRQQLQFIRRVYLSWLNPDRPCAGSYKGRKE